VTVALAYMATNAGLSVQEGAALIAVSVVPQVWKFFWAPVSDRTLTRKRWYLYSCVGCAIGMAGMATVPLNPNTMALVSAIVFMTSLASTFLGFAVEGLVAHITPPHDRGRVCGWFQAGNLGGAGLGGGFGLWLLDNVPSPWQAGLILAVMTLACCIPLRFVPDVPAEASAGSLWGAVKSVGSDMWHVLNSPRGILCGTLCFVPVGTGAASGVLAQAQVAAHWGAHAGEVELVQGFLSGGVSMMGCLAGGYICKHLLGSRKAYALFGGLMAVVTALMAATAPTVGAYVGFNLAYAFTMGLCFAAYASVILEAIGKGHAATKYNGFSSLANAPVWYMGLVLAKAETHWGPNGMLLTESGLAIVGIVIFAVTAAIVRRNACRAQQIESQRVIAETRPRLPQGR
jgi:MFS transporter, PAT family, beta-lactamase induction signal transducer AmpG